MGTISNSDKPHAVCIPYPAQGHITPMLKLAKLLHYHGFHITFVNTDFNHRRLLKSRGPTALNGLSSFRFESIPDGLPPTDVDATQDIPSLCQSTRRLCLQPFKELLRKVNSTPDVPPVSCIVSDGVMSFTVDAAEELGVPEVLFWTTSACGFLAYMHYRQLVDRGYTPLKDEKDLSNGYLETQIDWIPGMEGIRLRDMPSFVRTTDPEDGMVDFLISETKRAERASAIVLNTMASLEQPALNAISSLMPPVFSIGPLQLLLQHLVPDSRSDLMSLGSNLWKEDRACLEWLDQKSPNSVVYVNFGSITVMTEDQLKEFAWGLANSEQMFLWIIRPDLVAGETAVLPPEFVEATKERGMLTNWCPQEEVLNHPAVGGFLTHSGWNSTLESIVSGVPMLCWPFFAEQQTNCRYCCTEWGIGMEIDTNVKREDIQEQVKELMEGHGGKEMRKRAGEWKKLVAEAATPDTGSSFRNLNNLIHEVLLQSP
ncbi:7-deoxyloganetin glucosyltransferase-like [Cucurbita pepo subsp. pepo]|uniref:7-deoxyloganetin glucosyltransferase-like n=1 Tax=Cucurbita pepo subsp. pepo TaxID=3664 RepID=UPI000C9D8628|nr:7-deoxyloganetin glucosyltransferase-like [Cucurbita pepo subsp. pepo]